MLKLNGKIIKDTRFPDGTPNPTSLANLVSYYNITWNYENDSELFLLICLIKDLHDKGIDPMNISLTMPYLPNACMDRSNDYTNVFTLKYFAEIINQLHFHHVTVYDSHSNVSIGLIDRCINIMPFDNINKAILDNKFSSSNGDIIVFPDFGCYKRIGIKNDLTHIICNKERDWKTGQIKGIEILGCETQNGSIDKSEAEKILNGHRILLIDDICRYGGTAYYTIKKLKELGITDVFCYFSHLEPSYFGTPGWETSGSGIPILKNSNFINKIYTTNSLCTKEMEQKIREDGVDIVVYDCE